MQGFETTKRTSDLTLPAAEYYTLATMLSLEWYT